MKHAHTDLLARLDAIADSVAGDRQSLAVVGVGSVGTRQDRLDEHSDLDFFVLVQDGAKQPFLENLDWLDRVRPISFSFRNTVDGYKVLFDDGIFAEFAVFDPADISQIPATDVRVVWRSAGFDPATLRFQTPERHPKTADFLVGEALTNLYVGLCRLARGERLSAFRFIQVLAVDCVVQLAPLMQPAGPSQEDAFDYTRRLEQRFPEIAPNLHDWLQGYERSAESAHAILSFLERQFAVDPSLKAAIVAAAAATSSARAV
jgi:hypothetical protein